MAAGAELLRLEERIAELESRLYGDTGGRGGSKKLADGLIKVQASLGNIASKRERIKILYKKIDDLMKYLDPQYIDRVAVPDAMKLEFILAEEQFLHSQAALLEQMNTLQPLMDSAHIKAVPDHASKLQALAQTHIQQQDQGQVITEDVRKLLEDYNKMVSFKCCPNSTSDPYLP
ncbi:dynactin subunit 3 isoform X2 [Latimeria chalumnae]|uniref:dynactin subunit 3 isoform X2 n=1 Tax=Latimeria chalumnae TaxID=7897 RepID=UPI0002517398|nr:PREDICTED: dynactin subunit 3 isoform X2 [Latimeria chalumnae]|eukprot:XP_006013843.1 PREDICTED: dynactin subunit 3 isoform X2 [Latimeria chalumnae]